MKKVAIIIERANIALGGAERSVFELASALSASGLKVDILAAKGQTDSKKIHILCPHRPGKRTCYYTFASALRKHLEQNHYDIIHSVLPFDFVDVYQPRGGSFAESIIRNAASYQKSLMKSYKRITAFANFRRTRLLRAEKRLCKNPNGPTVTALSNYVADQFRRHYNLHNNRLVIIPNGIRVNKRVDRAACEKLRTQILMQAGVKEGDRPIFFLFVANNFRLKGLAVLIEAMHLAQNYHTNKNCYLIVAGNGRTHKYRHLARKLDILNKIVFLGAVRHIQNVLSITDVAVLPTFYDPSSRFILEALAAEKPVITTIFNGATDLFVNNRHGKIIDSSENILELAEAIGYFANTNNIKKASEAIAEDNLKEDISINRVVKQMHSLYESIIQRKSE